MWRDVLVASGVSALLGLLAFTYERYAYWRAWAPRRFAGGVLLFALSNAAAGALAVAAASLLNFEPKAGAWAFNGFVYALLAQGLVRIEPQGRDLRYIEQGRSILAKAQAFVEHFLDRGTTSTAEYRLSLLSDLALFDLASYLHGRYVAGDTDIPQRARVRRLAELNDAAQVLATGNTDGRGVLESYCLREIKARTLLPQMARLEPPGQQDST